MRQSTWVVVDGVFRLVCVSPGCVTSSILSTAALSPVGVETCSKLITFGLRHMFRSVHDSPHICRLGARLEASFAGHTDLSCPTRYLHCTSIK